MKIRSVLPIILAVIALAAGCSKVEFDGSIVKNNASFMVDFETLNRCESHDIHLLEGQELATTLTVESGRLDISVKDSAGNTHYKGDEVASSTFILKAGHEDQYTIAVTGEEASGMVEFRIVED